MADLFSSAGDGPQKIDVERDGNKLSISNDDNKVSVDGSALYAVSA